MLPQQKQRYQTEGDWLWKDNTLEIRISREVGEQDPRYNTLMFVHELVEALLCRGAGIAAARVDAFDMVHQKGGEPGDDPSAPYHRQYVAAEAAERALADQLGNQLGTLPGQIGRRNGRHNAVAFVERYF
jgi:hypothetical protein